MRQRVMIAMVMALKPDILIADEPTTALDVTVQGEVLELLRDLQRETGTGLILITHDMGVVAEMADRVIIMRDGCMIEQGSVIDISLRLAPITRANCWPRCRECGLTRRTGGCRGAAGGVTTFPRSPRCGPARSVSTCTEASSAVSTDASTR